MIKFALFGGLFGISLPHALFFLGIKHVDVGIAAAMISGIPNPSLYFVVDIENGNVQSAAIFWSGDCYARGRSNLFSRYLSG